MYVDLLDYVEISVSFRIMSTLRIHYFFFPSNLKKEKKRNQCILKTSVKVDADSLFWLEWGNFKILETNIHIRGTITIIIYHNWQDLITGSMRETELSTM